MLSPSWYSLCIPFLISRFLAPAHSFSHFLWVQVPLELYSCFSVPVWSPDSDPSLEGCRDHMAACQVACWSVVNLPAPKFLAPLTQPANCPSACFPHTSLNYHLSQSWFLFKQILLAVLDTTYTPLASSLPIHGRM